MVLGPLMIDLAGPELDAAERDLLRHPLVGGVILFSRNYQSRRQLTALTREIHALRTPRLLIAVDHEGGRVQRFRDEFTALPPMRTLGAAFAGDPEQALAFATELGWLMAAELRAVGLDFSFAPVLDLYASHSQIINDRAFDPDPDVVARLAQAWVRGMHAAGMAAVGKHFPGHGSVVADSHHELPVDERSRDDLDRRDLRPFRVLCAAGIEGIMPAHIVFPAVDSAPVGYSRIWIEHILRGELGFQGAVFSDDLAMAGAAVDGSYVERARRALGAGCDMLLICNQRPAVMAVLAGLGTEPQPLSQVRLMRMHGRPGALGESELATSARRAAVVATLASVAPAPMLALGDDAPA